MFCILTQHTVLVILVIIVKNSDQNCYKYPSDATIKCNSLKDLYVRRSLAKDISILDLTDHDQELRSVPLAVAKNYERLEIDWSIGSIAEDSLVNFVKLRHLVIRHNKLNEIPSGTFKNLNLTLLYFNGNDIKSIAPFAFINLTNLEDLSVKGGNLTKISFNVFNNLTVKQIMLSNNHISEIETFSFGNMPNLKRLVLDNNNLSEFIPQEQLHYPERLEWLVLGRNKLTEVIVYMLEGLTNLKYLYMEYNVIAFIEAKAFEETPKLESLALSYNYLKVISSNIFPRGGLNNLKVLYLDHNHLTYISSSFFFRLNALRSTSVVGNPWQCPCLDLVFRWLLNKGVKLSCDKEYRTGKRPVCVVPKSRDVCTYTYDEEYFEVFQNQSKRYPQPYSCV